jgi:hypothetical protein
MATFIPFLRGIGMTALAILVGFVLPTTALHLLLLSSVIALGIAALFSKTRVGQIVCVLTGLVNLGFFYVLFC